MTLEQIPMVIDWMAAIDPNNKMDRKYTIEQMRDEMLLAAKNHNIVHYIGYFDRDAAFFIVVLPGAGRPSISPSTLGMAGEYELFTLLPRSSNMDIFRVTAWAIHFVFSMGFVDSVLRQVKSTDQQGRWILDTLGFSELEDRETALGYVWYACGKEDFKFDPLLRDAGLKSGF
jgi:hypothetical protein